MGNIRTYRMGLKHGREGVRAMAHRRFGRYDSEGANRSYYNGYHQGIKERGTMRLDYSNPLNNQLFDKGT